MRRNSLVYQLSVLLENTSIDKELNELKRVVQYLKRDEDIDIGLSELKQLFYDSDEVSLDKKVWQKLENTESNQIKKGDFKKVEEIAKQYGKTNPKKLKIELESNTYDRPLIVKFNDRYHLVAGNTRLCTASAIGMTPKVIIAEIPKDLSEQNVSANVAGYQSPNIFSTKPPRKKDKKKEKSNLKQTYGGEGKEAPKSSKYTILRRSVKEVYQESLLREIDFKSIKPFNITPTKKSIDNNYIIFKAYTNLKDNVTIEYVISAIRPKDYDTETLVIANCIFTVNDDIDIKDSNKNLLGFKGLLQLYRTSFLFFENSIEDFNDACIKEWNPNGIVYVIQAADKNERKEAQKAKIYEKYIDFTFDNTYEKYKKGTKFELLKYFDDDE